MRVTVTSGLPGLPTILGGWKSLRQLSASVMIPCVKSWCLVSSVLWMLLKEVVQAGTPNSLHGF